MNLQLQGAKAKAALFKTIKKHTRNLFMPPEHAVSQEYGLPQPALSDTGLYLGSPDG